MDFLNSELERMEISMTGAQYEEFYGIIAELSNNTRIPENRGFTPNEIYEMMKVSDKPKKIVLGQNLKSDFKNGSLNREEFVQGLINSDMPHDLRMQMLNEISKVKTNIEKTKKIGRNEPCPCGSGKKYKKCCGK